MEKEKKSQPNVVLTMPEAEYIRDLIAYDAKHKIL